MPLRYTALQRLYRATLTPIMYRVKEALGEGLAKGIDGVLLF